MNQYVEERCIGRGSYGCAYLVTEASTGDKYVVKKIPVELMTDKEKQQAFAEVDLLAQLDSPFVVQYRESFVEGSVLHIVMGYCDGGDLAGCIKAQPECGGYFDLSRVLDWFVQMACAIKYLHQRRILHRDLKTSNIFLTRKDIVKLGDFGIARTLNSTMDQAKTVVGTPYYMSPEVCESKPYSYASDIWALGCVLYEICTLKHAFDAPNILMLIVKIIQHDFAPLPACYPPEISDLLKALLDKNPDRRPTIDDILRAPLIVQHMQQLHAKGGHLSEHFVREAKITPLVAPPSVVEIFEYSYDDDDDSSRWQVATPTQTVVPATTGWVHADGDEVEERIETEELLKPNYATEYTQECLASKHINYGRKVVRRKALTIDQKVNLKSIHYMSKLHLDAELALGVSDDDDEAAVAPVGPKRGKAVAAAVEPDDNISYSGSSNYDSGDDDDHYTSMSEYEAEENFYSDDSDFDDDGPPRTELFAYSEDFEDTEAEVIEYAQDEVDDGASISSDSEDIIVLPHDPKQLLLESYTGEEVAIVRRPSGRRASKENLRDAVCAT
ncbi:NEK protein kinase [Saprolegnia parasitica CBS 223.65]|uniref:non-specific serine/threonine protein kinase n=1 Tax=Saprolegnia parasitica (strain CBS 223.65) TaxID=695850 RepID=A0A067C0R6_SAPPC|nr:NEK protein kinase [Saprolegnia parasitica CBS 223.65]KDO20417.1 NEK protein kinase [Saprolegnia parasitica CBS 223.65]|eukprot:XP_012208873.1 NEK protein kinase [Saprolegnia parasitica CBS 223.65]